MAGVFEGATRVAIAEIIQKHAQESKFGYILSQESYQAVIDDVYDLLKTSRNLKSAGDRFLSRSMEGDNQTDRRRR